MAMRTQKYKLACLIALSANVENGNCVHLNNAYSLVKEVLTRNQWAGYLSALQQEGKYRPAEHEYQGHFGYVL